MGCGSSRTEEGPINFVAKPPTPGNFFKTKVQNKSPDNLLDTVFYGSLRKGQNYHGALYNSELELDDLRDIITGSDEDEIKNKKYKFNFDKFKVIAVGGIYVNKVVAEGNCYVLCETDDKPSGTDYIALLVPKMANLTNWFIREKKAEVKQEVNEVLVMKNETIKPNMKNDEPAEEKEEQPVVNVNVNVVYQKKIEIEDGQMALVEQVEDEQNNGDDV